MKVQDPNYEISTLNGIDGAFYDPYHEMIQESESDSYLVWQMTEEDNMGNYSGSAGIRPGSHGKISFYVTPKVETVYLDFSFEIIGYRYSETTATTPNAEEGETTVTSREMIPITSSSPNETERSVSNYLNGHILLFENRTLRGDDIIYSGLIASNDDMKRIIERPDHTNLSVLQSLMIMIRVITSM